MSDLDFDVSNLLPVEQKQLLNFVHRNHDVFSTSMSTIGHTHLYLHKYNAF
jgi:hypothetical protein